MRVRVLALRRAVGVGAFGVLIACTIAGTVAVLLRNANDSLFGGALPDPGVARAVTFAVTVAGAVAVLCAVFAFAGARPVDSSIADRRGVDARRDQRPEVGAPSRAWGDRDADSGAVDGVVAGGAVDA
jgi:hypothetical protein